MNNKKFLFLVTALVYDEILGTIKTEIIFSQIYLERLWAINKYETVTQEMKPTWNAHVIETDSFGGHKEIYNWRREQEYK